MTIVQGILLVLIIVSFILYLAKFRKGFIDKIILLMLLACGITFIVVPDITSAIANKIGVGRGVDLIFYLFIMTSVFLLITLYSKIKFLEKELTSLTRELAKEFAKKSE